MKRIDPIRGLIIIVMISLGFSAVSIGITNLVSLNTHSLIQSNTRANTILDAINQTQITVEESRQNQTERLLPIFLDSFNQTELILNQTQDIIDNQEELIRLFRNQTN